MPGPVYTSGLSRQNAFGLLTIEKFLRKKISGLTFYVIIKYPFFTANIIIINMKEYEVGKTKRNRLGREE